VKGKWPSFDILDKNYRPIPYFDCASLFAFQLVAGVYILT